MLPFDVILFDVGGVLLTNGWDHGERAAAVEKFHLDAADLDARHEKVFADWDRGAITMDDYLNSTVFYEPRSFSREEFSAFVLSQSRVLPDGALPILKELAAAGNYLLGALNNEARETNDYRFKTFGLRNYIDVALSSCYLGLRKPEEAIFRLAIDVMGSKPERILFIDDRQENVDAAKAQGMVTIRFQGADALRSELNELGVC
jgi:putative hydrolase of the HAD superfamily